MLREHPDLRRILLAGATTESAIELYSFYMPIYGHSLGLSAFRIGALIGLFAVGMVVVRVLLAWMLSQRGEEGLMRIAMVIAAAVYCAFPFTRETAYLGLLSFVLGLSLGCCNPLGQSIIHARAPSGRSGESMRIRQLINKSTGFAAPLLYGAFGTIVSMVPVFWASSALLLGGSSLVSARAKSAYWKNVVTAHSLAQREQALYVNGGPGDATTGQGAMRPTDTASAG